MVARLILVFGLPGSGKSTLAHRLAKRLSGLSLNSDVLRTELGLKGDYRMETIAAVYEEMMRRARHALDEGGTVVLDGSFSNRRFREQAQTMASETGASLALIYMVADEKTTLRRVGSKRKVSEAGPEAYELLKRHFEPVEGEHLRLDSSKARIGRLLDEAAAYVSETTAAL